MPLSGKPLRENGNVTLITKDEKEFFKYEARVNHILAMLDDSHHKAVWYSSVMDLAQLVMTHAESELDQILDHLNNFQIGRLSSYVMTPSQCQEAFDSVTAFASRDGLVPVMSLFLRSC